MKEGPVSDLRLWLFFVSAFVAAGLAVKTVWWYVLDVVVR